MRRTIAIVFCMTVATASSLGHADSALNGTWQADPGVLELGLSYGLFDCFFCTPFYRIQADGRDHMAPDTGFDTVRVTQIDARTVSVVGKKGRDPLMLVVMTVSADGATLLLQQRIARPGERPIEQTETLTRQSAGSPKSHAISGRWGKPTDDDFTSFQISSDTIVRKDSQGTSFRANLDGSDAPYYGRPGVSVSVNLIDDRTLEQKDKKDGKVFVVERLTADRDMKTLHIRYEYPNGQVSKQTAHRIEGKVASDRPAGSPAP